MSFHSTKASFISEKKSNVPSGSPQITNQSAFERALKTSSSASLTIEAALALPIFMFFSVCIVHFLILLFLQSDIQLHVDEAARDLSKSLYLSSSSSVSTLAEVNSLSILSKILDDELTDRLNNSKVRNGASGLSAYYSEYNDETGELDIIVTYTYDFPFLPEGMAALNFCQQCRTRAWIGLDLCEDSCGAGGTGSSDASESGQTVYITPTGTAYHLSASCSYLDLSIHTVSADSVSGLRNSSGGIYKKCSCVSSDCTSVYITNYGDQYHGSLTCSDLKRTVEAVDISDIEGRHPCPKCASGTDD